MSGLSATATATPRIPRASGRPPAPGRGGAPSAAAIRHVAVNQAIAACPAVKATANTASTARSAHVPSNAPTVPANGIGPVRVRTSAASRRLTEPPSRRWAHQTSRLWPCARAATTGGMTSMPAPRTPRQTCPAIVKGALRPVPSPLAAAARLRAGGATMPVSITGDAS